MFNNLRLRLAGGTFRLHTALVYLVASLVIISCMSSGGNPVVPAETDSGPIQQDMAATNRYIWGIWNVMIDPEDQSVDVVPVRISEMHLNITRLLENSCSDCLQFTNLQGNVPTDFSIDVTVKHPLSENLNLSVFDVRGILVNPADTIFAMNGKMVALGDDVMRMINVDGYSDVFNPTDFPEDQPDVPYAFKYYSGEISTGGELTGTLNPFMAFCKFTPRRLFDVSTPQTITMNIQAPGWPLEFGYIIESSWAMPIGDVIDPVTDFPPEANCLEAYQINATINGFTDDPNDPDDFFYFPISGMTVPISVEIFDHQGADTIEKVRVESPALFDGLVELSEVSSSGNQAVFEGEITNSNYLSQGSKASLLIGVEDVEDDPVIGQVKGWQVCQGEVPTGLIVGDIQYDEKFPDEYDRMNLFVPATGDTGITYNWYVKQPVEIGKFYNQNQATTELRIGGVDQDDVQLEIRVAVESDNFGPVTQALTLVIQDKITTSDLTKEIDFFPGIEFMGNNGNVFTYEFTGGQPDIAQGDIITSLDDPPYLIRVDNVLFNSQTMEIEASPASIEDAIINGTIEVRIDCSGSSSGDIFRQGAGDLYDLEYLEFLDPIDEDLDEMIFNVAWGPGIFYKTNNPIDLTLSFIEDSHIVLASKLVVRFEASWNGDIAFDVNIYDTDLDIAARVLAEFSAQYNDSKSISVPIPYGSLGFDLGPVYGVIGLTLEAGYDLNALCEGDVTYGYYFTWTDFTVGGKVSGNIWSPLDTTLEPIFDLGTIKYGEWPTSGAFSAEMNCNGTIKAYLRPKLGAEFGGWWPIPDTALWVDVKPYILGEVNFTGVYPDNWCLTLDAFYGYPSLFHAALLGEELNWDVIPDASDGPFRICGSDNPYIPCWHAGPCSDCDLIVGQVLGPNEFLENTTESYSISASGDSGITYQWSCIPTGAGVFESPNSSTTGFTANEVESDEPVTIKVIVNSDNCDTTEKTKDITILNSCDLNVGTISGPSTVEENTTETYSVSASGDSGITYQWSCTPTGAGVFGSPNSSSTGFIANEVTSDMPAIIKVVVASDSCDPTERTKNITILNSCNLSVGNISGPGTVEENTTETYSISASGDSGITYQWSCTPTGAGVFGSPNSSTTGFTANEVGSDQSATIKVYVNSNNCDQVEKTKGITILDDPCVPPNACLQATSSTDINAGDSVSFDANCSTGTEPLAFEWDMNLDGEPDFSGFPEQTIPFPNPGTFNVYVWVDNDCGYDQSDPVVVTVCDSTDPSVNFIYPATTTYKPCISLREALSKPIGPGRLTYNRDTDQFTYTIEVNVSDPSGLDFVRFKVNGSTKKTWNPSGTSLNTTYNWVFRTKDAYSGYRWILSLEAEDDCGNYKSTTKEVFTVFMPGWASGTSDVPGCNETYNYWLDGVVKVGDPPFWPWDPPYNCNAMQWSYAYQANIWESDSGGGDGGALEWRFKLNESHWWQSPYSMDYSSLRMEAWTDVQDAGDFKIMIWENGIPGQWRWIWNSLTGEKKWGWHSSYSSANFFYDWGSKREVVIRLEVPNEADNWEGVDVNCVGLYFER